MTNLCYLITSLAFLEVFFGGGWGWWAEDGRDVSLLSADQALIVSDCDHSFPTGPRSSHLASRSWTREPSSELTAASEVNSDASRPEVSPGAARGLRGLRVKLRRGMSWWGARCESVTRCQHRLSWWCHDHVGRSNRMTKKAMNRRKEGQWNINYFNLLQCFTSHYLIFCFI